VESDPLVEIWEMLEVLVVSLDRIGAHAALRGKEAGVAALDEFFSPELNARIVRARRLCVELIESRGQEASDLLDALAENESEMGYWGAS
jgi:hypothetical protein